MEGTFVRTHVCELEMDDSEKRSKGFPVGKVRKYANVNVKEKDIPFKDSLI